MPMRAHAHKALFSFLPPFPFLSSLLRTVINLEPPLTPQAYTHRVGRTGRAGQAGTAITLLGAGDAELATELEAQLAKGAGAATSSAAGAAAGATPEAEGGEAEPGVEGGEGAAAEAAGALPLYPHLTRAAVDALRYRTEDVARSITKNVVREVGTVGGGGGQGGVDGVGWGGGSWRGL